MRFRLWVPILVAVLAAGLASGCSKSPKPATDMTANTDPTHGQKDGNTITNPQPAVTTINPSEAIEDVFFDFDRYEIRADARRVLQNNAGYLKNEFPQLRIMLEGHCDERGTAEYNLALGQRRADAVRAYLIDLGVQSNRMTTVSYGEEKPYTVGHTEEAWTQNRRVHFNSSAS